MEGALEMNWCIVEMPYPQLRKRLCLAAHFHLITMIDWNENMKQVQIYSYNNLYNSWLRWSIPPIIWVMWLVKLPQRYPAQNIIDNINLL